MQAFSEKQRELATWWAEGRETSRLEGVIAEGAIRSGKTWAMVLGFLLWSQRRFNGQRFIVAGVTVEALKRNVVAPMGEILRQLGWAWSFNRSENRITIGTNTYHLFGANTERSQDALQGLTAAGCYADEVALFPKSFVDQMVARCSVGGSRLWFNCNPSYPTHFFKTEWVDRAAELGLLHLHFTMDDNPTLSQEIIARYGRMYTGVFHDRYILGLWTLAEGLVYPAYADAVEDGAPGPEAVAKWAVSLDYGTQNAFAALLWGFDGLAWHVCREYRYSGRDEGHQKTDADYVADMADFVEGLPERPEFIVDPSATSFIAAMRRAGFKVRKARNDVMDGIRETGTCMAQGGVRIAAGCTGLIKELGGYAWDSRADGDRPVKVEDHSCDALRYGVATLRMYKPQKQQVNPLFDRGGRGRWQTGRY